ncbi:tyrosine-type recombinase/integrase [Crateriforma conspicua]|uniref:Site-specific tyrosine recombinase XerC n=1 Tax=Crateriforma conspicua TaxID=2527996 RepID=A0A5C5Y3N8_9PLAN|nr:site-specific integrase [Crateriforma conspicua]TWT69343.1 site-specific tyrosine recombinase XerC [Crateriforma conspicua]
MARPKATMPSYRLHRSTKRAVVTIDGKDFYLGKYNSPESKAEYARLMAEYAVTGKAPRTDDESDAITVTELLASYWRHARTYYVKNGRPTSEQAAMKFVLRTLRRLFGDQPATEFGPIALKVVRQEWIDAGHSRGTINRNVQRITRVFKWAASEELLPVSVHQALATVDGLRKGRSAARETERIAPIDLKIVEATMQELTPVVADMVRLQMLTGMRPVEVCSIRPCDVDRSGDVWEYHVDGHKTEHHERDRVVYIGPEAQALLAPYLLRDAQTHCFSPREADRQFRQEKRAKRQRPLRYEYRRSRQDNRIRHFYDTSSYRRAIHRACDRAFPPAEELTGDALKAWQSDHRWSPNRIRHTTATEVRRRFGLEAAQVILGHSVADVTQIYAERDAEKAREVARAIG